MITSGYSNGGKQAASPSAAIVSHIQNIDSQNAHLKGVPSLTWFVSSSLSPSDHPRRHLNYHLDRFSYFVGLVVLTNMHTDAVTSAAMCRILMHCMRCGVIIISLPFEFYRFQNKARHG